MADWLRLPSGQAVNMDLIETVYGENGVDPSTLVWLRRADGDSYRLDGPDAAAVLAYLERVHVGERP